MHWYYLCCTVILSWYDVDLLSSLYKIKSQPWGIKNQPFTMTASLCKIKSQPWGVKNQPFTMTASLCKIKSQPWGIINQPLTMTAPLCKNKKSAIGYKKSAMWAGVGLMDLRRLFRAVMAPFASPNSGRRRHGPSQIAQPIRQDAK